MERLAYPNESAEYRTARNALLGAEIALRRQLESVAAMRRALPPGGAVPEDYVFERIGANGMPEPIALSALFADKPSLILYSFMYGPDRDTPCPGCTHMLDSLDGVVRHAPARTAVWIVAKSPIARLIALARDRGWPHLRFLSTAGNSYDADYFGDTSKLSDAMRAERGYEPGKNWDEPMFNVFRKDGGAVRHFWGSDMLYVQEEPGQNHRAGDLIDPLWGLLDLTPEGRGDFFPKLAYR